MCSGEIWYWKNSARLVNLNEALERIKKAAKDSLKLIGKIKYKPILPLEIKLGCAVLICVMNL